MSHDQWPIVTEALKRQLQRIDCIQQQQHHVMHILSHISLFFLLVFFLPFLFCRQEIARRLTIKANKWQACWLTGWQWMNETKRIIDVLIIALNNGIYALLLQITQRNGSNAHNNRNGLARIKIHFDKNEIKSLKLSAANASTHRYIRFVRIKI